MPQTGVVKRVGISNDINPRDNVRVYGRASVHQRVTALKAGILEEPKVVVVGE